MEENNRSIVDLFDSICLKNPNKVAIQYGIEKYTYSKLRDIVDNLVITLYTYKKFGTVFGLYLDKTPQFIMIVLALWKIGCSYIPIDLEFPLDRINYMLQNSKIKNLIYYDKLDDKVFNVENKIELMNIFLEHKESNIVSDERVKKDDIVYTIYTSGSTGKPKGVNITNDNLVNFILGIYNESIFCSEDRLLSITTVSFDISILEMFLPLMFGATVIIGNKRLLIDMKKLSEAIEKYQITILQATPLTWNMLVNSGWKNNNNIKILCGGEKLEEELSQKLFELSTNVWNLYGPTETTIWSSVHKLEYAGDNSIGKPIKNMKFYLISENLKHNENEGELYIGGLCVSKGYLNNENLTQERFIVNPFNKDEIIYKTGDIVKFIDGNYFYIGRNDFQIKLNGHRIEIEEIEKNILAINEVEQAVVVPDNNTKIIYAFVKINGKITEIQIKEQLSKFLTSYMIPKRIFFISKFPTTFNNKIDKSFLIKKYIYEKNNLEMNEYNELKEKIKSSWEKVLKVKVDYDSPYYEYNIDSLKMVEICLAMSELGINISFDIFIQQKSINNIVDYIYNKSSNIKEDMQYFNNIKVKKVLQQYKLCAKDVKIYDINKIENQMLCYSMVNPKGKAYQDCYIFKLKTLDSSRIKSIFYEVIKKINILKTLYLFGVNQKNIKIYSDKFENLCFCEELTIEKEDELEKFIKEKQSEVNLISNVAIKLYIVNYNNVTYLIFNYPHIRLDGKAFFKIVYEILKRLESEKLLLKCDKTVLPFLTDNVFYIKDLKQFFGKEMIITEYIILKSLEEYLNVKFSNVNFTINIKKQIESYKDIGNNIFVYDISVENIDKFEEYKKLRNNLKIDENKKINTQDKCLLINEFNMEECFGEILEKYNIDMYHKEFNNFKMNICICQLNENIKVYIDLYDSIDRIKLEHIIDKNLKKI